MRILSPPRSILLALGLAACASGGGGTETASPPAAGGAEPPSTTAPAQPAPTAAAAGGSHFTQAQADDGRDTFRSLCTECHYSGEFSDAQFKFKWSRRSADDLYDIIFTQMPESAPGSLSPDEAVSLVAYILGMNGFQPGGTALPADPAVLAGISLASIRN